MAPAAPSAQAALRGEPSYVWRSGQERRLRMMVKYCPALQNGQALLLEHGCGNGIYAAQFQKHYGALLHGFDIEAERVAEAHANGIDNALLAVAERLPYASNSFDLVFSNEVIEHVQDDALAAAEMVRVAKAGGRIIIFCPNRWYPFETHGHYWRGQYRFGNTPLINYLPNVLRNRLAPHVRVYTAHGLRRLFAQQPVKVVHHGRIFGGYDNIVARAPALGKLLQGILYPAEATPFRFFGLSHFLVLEKNLV
jgi:SAM-dependent methyltransferase